MNTKSLLPNIFVRDLLSFLDSCSTKRPGEYRMWREGEVTLYSSCFAAMTLHYIGKLQNLDEDLRRKWSDYILQWQDPKTGLFIGPEIVTTELTSPTHNYEHVTMHLAAHVLPTLHILGAVPKYPLRFAHSFLAPLNNGLMR